VKKVISSIIALLLAPLAQLNAVAPKPNILIIMFDDMGFSDIGCYGSEIHTPNIDRIAASGMKFSQMYNTSKCYPTRACLMTGVYYQRTDNGTFPNTATIGEVLRPAGYNTWWVGKHHGQFNPYTRGFDHYYGLIGGAENHHNPTTLPRAGVMPASDNGGNTWSDDLSTVDSASIANDLTFYDTNAFTDKALQWLDTAQNDGKPFFLYMAYTAPHWPVQALPEDIAKYNGVYDVGYTAIRNARYQRQIDLGLIDPAKAPLPDLDTQNLLVWDSLTPAQKQSESMNMQIYAAMIDRVDQNVGRLLQKLQDQGKLDNTLILFFSDNGACAENPSGVNIAPNATPGSMGSFISYGATWAQVSNTPLRKWKQDSYEGGIHTPFLASWPAGIAQQSGWNREPVHMIDVMPTLLELAGASYPGESTQPNIPPMDGTSLVPAFAGNIIARTNPLFFQFDTGSAVRDGQWKIVRLTQKAKTPWELYDMDTDGTEKDTGNQATTHPEIVTLMANKYNAWMQNCLNANLSGSAAYNFYTLTINGGSGSGYYYTSGQQIPISANTLAKKDFTFWTGSTTSVASINAASTTVTMPAQNISLTSNYLNQLGWSTLTINGGSGSGAYNNNQSVVITANPKPGNAFNQWTGATQYLNNVAGATAQVTMPAQDITLTANYTCFLSTDNFDSNDFLGGSGWSGGWSTSTLSTTGTATISSGVAKLTLDASITRSFTNPLTNATLSFDWDLDRIDSSESGTVEVFNGIAWKTVFTSSDKGLDANGTFEPTSTTIQLPAGISQIRFKINGNTSGDTFFLDNIKIVVNQPPIFTLKPLSGSDAKTGSLYNTTLAGSATDANSGDTLTYSRLTGPSWLNVATNGDLSGTPSVTDVGTNVFTIKVADNANASDTATLTINVLPDYTAWANQYSLTQGQQGDDDGDGNSNFFEFIAGLIPTDPNSVFTTQVVTVSGQPNQVAVTFGPIISGRTYTVKSRDSLTNGSWTALSGTTPSDAVTGGITKRTIVDTLPSGGKRFYLVEINMP
jgi:arylsulfatase A-like enzyme